MSVDKHTLQQWVAGAEASFEKTHKPMSGLPVLKHIKNLAEQTRSYMLKEKIDLTRAKNFRAQQAAEDLMCLSIELPLLGKRGVGNDSGMAVATFEYVDREGDEHSLVVICSYTVSGMVAKERALKRVLVIPVV